MGSWQRSGTPPVPPLPLVWVALEPRVVVPELVVPPLPVVELELVEELPDGVPELLALLDEVPELTESVPPLPVLLPPLPVSLLPVDPELEEPPSLPELKADPPQPQTGVNSRASASSWPSKWVLMLGSPARVVPRLPM
jgi:hypothetical protein